MPLSRASNTPRRLQALALCVVALSTTHAGAQKVDEGARGRTVRIQRDPAAARTEAMVYEGVFSYVRIERAEAGATASLHPVNTTAAALRKALAGVQFDGEALLNDGELGEIVPPLLTALAQATPAQDVSFAVSGRHGGFVLGASRSVTTGRVFRTAEGLQLIVGLAHKSFEPDFNATGILMPFEPGRRAGAVDRSVKLADAEPGASLKRADWVSLTLDSAAPAAATAPAPAAPNAAASVAPRAAAPAKAAPAADADALYQSVAERLKALNRLRDAGLVTPQEYEEKRKQILSGL